MAWVPKPHAEDHAARHADGGADELDAADLASGAATDGHVLTADGAGGAAWEAVPADALDDLSDVTITTPSTGEVLKYNGSGWVNDTDDTGSGLPSASTKGDIAVYNGTSWVIVSAGANDTVLTADSAQSAGVKWAAGGGVPSATTSWTPTITQGVSVTVTVNFAEYVVIGPVAYVWWELNVTSAGTSGSAIVIGGQPAAIQSVRASAELVIGHGEIDDSGTAHRSVRVLATSATGWRMQFYNDFANAGTAGVISAFALASGDRVNGFAQIPVA